MRSVFWKGMLTFLVVILVAIGTVALLSVRATEVEFRRYALTQEGRWAQQVAELVAYYVEHGSWEGVQDTLYPAQGRQGRGRGSGGGDESGGIGPPNLDFRLADQDGRIVGDTGGALGGDVSQGELASGVPIEVEGLRIGRPRLQRGDFLCAKNREPGTIPRQTGHRSPGEGGCDMTADTVAQMTRAEFKEMLETLIEATVEQKLLEMLGDSDEGLEIKRAIKDRPVFFGQEGGQSVP